MIRHEPRLPEREAQVVEQVGQIVDVVGGPELPPDQLLDQQDVPAPGRDPGGFRAGLDDDRQPLPLGRGQLRRPSTRKAWSHAYTLDGLTPTTAATCSARSPRPMPNQA